MTAPQNPITRAIWDGTLPIKFSLDSTEAAELGAKVLVEPYFVSFFLRFKISIEKFVVEN